MSLEPAPRSGPTASGVPASEADRLPDLSLRGITKSFPGVLANDMESATLMVVSALRRWRAGVLLVCVDELDAGEIHHVDPALIHRMIDVAVEAVRSMIEGDRAAAHQ